MGEHQRTHMIRNEARGITKVQLKTAAVSPEFSARKEPAAASAVVSGDPAESVRMHQFAQDLGTCRKDGLRLKKH